MGAARSTHEIRCPVCDEKTSRCEWERGERVSADGWRIDVWIYFPCGHTREGTVKAKEDES